MRISELIEQTISSIGSTKAEPGQVPQVSQTPAPGADKSQETDPTTQQLAALLKQNKVVDTDADVNTFMGAAQASLNKRPLNPDQQEIMGKLAGPLMTNPKLVDKIKLLMPNKPGATNQPAQPTQQKQPGATL